MGYGTSQRKALLIIRVEWIGSVQVIKDARSLSEVSASVSRTRLAPYMARKPGLEAHQHDGTLVQVMHADNMNEMANGMVWETVSDDQTQSNPHTGAAAAASEGEIDQGATHALWTRSR